MKEAEEEEKEDDCAFLEVRCTGWVAGPRTGTGVRTCREAIHDVPRQEVLVLTHATPSSTPPPTSLPGSLAAVECAVL